MWHALEVTLVGGRWAVVGLVALGGAVAPWVAQVKRRVGLTRPQSVEVAPLEVGGVRYGAVYEDGRLVGWLEGVDRV